VSGIARVASGIEGFDLVSDGGLPLERLTLVAGTAGSGKTLFATQFLAEGAANGEPGVLVTFEERPEDIARNFATFGWDIPAWEREGLWAGVDASPRYHEETVVAGEYDLASLVLRVRHAVEKVGAKRLAIDSTGALIEQLGEATSARRALFQIASQLSAMGVTAIMTAERSDDYGPISRFGFEEFVADNVVILRNALEGEKRRRTAEVLKLRGGTHLRGEHLFTVLAERGIVVVPQKIAGFGAPSSRTRLPSGNPALDEMCHGGFFDRSLVLVSGATGTGKSLLTSQFVATGGLTGERALLLSFEESREQLHRNAASWGMDFAALEDAGRLRILAEAPEAKTLEDHLLSMKSEIDDFAPDRVAIDSVTALERIATARSFREYLLGLSFHIRQSAVLGLVTSASEDLGSAGHGGLHISTVSDAIVLLQYVGRGSTVGRAINVLKIRGSDHDKSIREYTVGADGMQIGDPVALHSWQQLPQVYEP
jgi:circadian clock protein KaiC